VGYAGVCWAATVDAGGNQGHLIRRQIIAVQLIQAGANRRIGLADPVELPLLIEEGRIRRRIGLRTRKSTWGENFMKHLESILWLSTLLLLSGCGGGRNSGSTSGSGPTSNPPPVGVNVVSNWQFSTTSTVAGMASLTIAGSISVSGSSVSGAVHVAGSNCFDRLTIVVLTGTLSGSSISLTSGSVAGQVVTFTGSFSDPGTFQPGNFTGTYAINGGCANGDKGNATGVKVLYVGNTLNGTFTTSGGGTFSVTGDMAQDSASSAAGSFKITGSVTFNTSCFSAGTMASRTFPLGSFILGTSVALEIPTGNGTLVFLGTLNQATGEIDGNYTVSGGTCDQSGTAVLMATSPWDY
jgi:hypothetical protein